MYLCCDAREGGRIELREVERFDELAVWAVGLTDTELDETLRVQRVGSVVEGAAWLSRDTLRLLGPRSGSWLERFEDMLAFATARGWVRGTDGAVQAHVERSVRLVISGGVGHIAFHRPEVANALNLSMARGIEQAVRRCAADDVSAVLLTGAGDRFCAGGDVDSFLRHRDPASYVAAVAGAAVEGVDLLSLLPKPVVASVQGAAAGGGLGFVLAADFAVAQRGAVFAAAYATIGLTPDCGVSHLLPRVVGLRRALEFLLLERRLSAEEALEWGLVSAVSDDAVVDAAELAHKLAAGPAFALGEARRLIRASSQVARGEQTEDEVKTIATAVSTEVAAERIARFTERHTRQPGRDGDPEPVLASGADCSACSLLRSDHATAS